MNIKQSIIAALSIFIVVMSLNSYVGYSATKDMSVMLKYIAGPAWDTADGAMEGQIELEKQIIIVARLQQKQIASAQAQTEMELAISRADAALGRMKSQQLIDTKELAQLAEHLENFAKIRTSTFSALLAGTSADANMAQFNAAVGDLLSFISELEEVADSKVEGESNHIDALVKRAKTQLLLAFMAVLGICALVLVMARHLILKPIAQVTQQLNELSLGSGDLTQRLPHANGDSEMGRLALAFNGFVQKLHGLVGQVQQSNYSLIAASGQIAHSIGSSAEVASAQEQEISLVAEAAQKIADSLYKVGYAAGRANEASELAVLSTRTGNQVVALAQQGVDQVATEVELASQVIELLVVDSRNISAMLEVIRSIAEQTNLLALNAAIEAARAGESGRGFAVVADEVRSLALRTQESTKSIETIIANLSNGSAKAVQAMAGAQKQALMFKERIGTTSDAFAAIVQVVEQIKSMNADIAQASEDERREMGRINDIMASILKQARSNLDAAGLAQISQQHLDQEVAKTQALLKQFKT